MDIGTASAQQADMIRFRLFAVMFAVIVVPFLSTADARLLRQKLEGTRRICVYNDRSASTGRWEEVKADVPRGSVCPLHPPREEEVMEPAVRVPMLATLESEERENGRRVCRYVYQGRRYDRPVASTQPCSYTPN